MPGALRAPGEGASGKRRGHRFTGQGRRHVRRALYLAVLSAMRAGSPFAPFVCRSPEKGKAGKTIAIAVARKLLTIAGAVLRDAKPFRASRKTQFPGGGRAHARRAARTGRW
ncbi:MAG: hypothetical protein D6832_05915, partial [Alphaproteobacteria bacterium]